MAKKKDLPDFDKHFTVSEVSLKYKPEIAIYGKAKLNNSMNLYNVFSKVFDADTIGHRESFYALYMNRAFKGLGVMKVSEGGLVGTVVDFKMIIQAALRLNACRIALCHNHPSGQLNASVEDLKVTKAFITACNTMEIDFTDHLIISPAGDYISFMDHNLI